MNADGGVRSVQRALDLLRRFDEDRMAWTVSDLARACELPKSTVVRMIATLEGAGMLWTRPDGQITVGAGLLRWARLARAAWEVPEAVRQVMREVAQECGETVNLYVRQDVVRVSIAQEEGTRTLRHILRVGDELPLWAGGASKVLLIGAPGPVVRAVAARSPRGESFHAELAAQIAAAERDGYAVSHGEREEGVSGIGAPIVDAEGRVVAAIALGGPTSRFTPDRITAFAARLVAAARRISDLRVLS
ncbi:IclR family transcriptional regulator [Nonomuraea lactucae]|uniref:IclR family transcriptional regulator n=1 Tax=Nonomuraea lactucae TaxID=2249762 RepID=UPI000DE1F485|nr:IclR family transcriptional regulator [Nonomuraea lactucae]